MRVADRSPAPYAPVFVGRREPPMGYSFYGQDVNLENVPVNESPQGAPDPVRYSDFYAQGRAPSERWPGVNVAFHMNIAGIQAVAQDTFLTGKSLIARENFMKNGLGGQAAWTVRQNIERGTADPYGNRVQVRPLNQVPANAVVANGLAFSPRGFRR